MLGKETYTVVRPHKANPAIQVSWAYPNSYEVGMAGLGYQLVWWLMEQDEDTRVCKVFTDCQEPGWQNSELMGFTLSWELDYINVLKLLDKAGLSLLAASRADEDPIVFGGGPVLTANPEPFAEFFDVILLGDAEAVIPSFLAGWKQVRHLSREEKLSRLAQIDGIYIPRFYKYQNSRSNSLLSVVPVIAEAPAEIGKQVFSPPPDYVAHSVMLSAEATWANRFLVEVARSCPQECRFCLASYLTRPFRPANVATLMEKIDLGLKHTSNIGLLGPSVTEHPQFGSIAENLLKRPGTDISIASVRADSLTADILAMLVKLGQRSVTIAIESGSERLRAVMKKNLTEQEIRQAVDLIDASGMDGLKFYGIVGLPGETAEDLTETVRLLAALKKAHRRLRFVFGVSSFVPKAQTPFQWAGRDRRCKEKLEYVRKHLARVGIDVRPESHNWSDIQALLSRGDRRLTATLIEVAQGKGNLGAWHKALRHLPPGCPDEHYYVYRNIPYTETLPWSHIVNQEKISMLLRHSQNAESLATVGDRMSMATDG